MEATISIPVPEIGILSQDASASNLQFLFSEALDRYRDDTGIDIVTHPVTDKLKSCRTVDSVVSVFQNQLHLFESVRSSGKKAKVITALKPTIEIMLSLLDSEILRGVVGSVFPPANAIFSGIGILLGAMKKINTDYDGIVDIFNSISRFLERLRIYVSDPPPGVSSILVKTIVELLSTSSIITKRLQQGWFKAIYRSLLEDTEIEEALKRLDKLTNEELATAVAEILKTLRSVARDVSVVRGDVEVSSKVIQENFAETQKVAQGLSVLQRNDLQRRFREWLSPPDPTTNHHKACSVRHDGSARWFFHGNEFKEWKTNGTLFWIHGKVGSGKTVLCSAIVDHLRRHEATTSATVVYFYCDFQDTAKQGVNGILCSLLIQLCEQSDTYLNILYGLVSSTPEGSSKPGDETLLEWMKYMLALPVGDRTKYIVMDALDECPSIGLPTPRASVVSLIRVLCSLSRVHNIRLCVTSRLEHDIRSNLEPLSSHSMSLEVQRGQAQDMADCISSVIESDSQMKEWDTETKDLVIRVLSEKAHGMFRYVHCQLETLRDCQTSDIQTVLDTLPEGLEGTYEHMLQRIPETKWKYVHRLLQCLTFVARPLSVAEAAEILAIDFDSNPIPTLHPERRPNDPEAAIMSTCSSFVVILSGDRTASRIVQFAHMSVQEYLTSERLANLPDERISRYHVIPELAHTFLAQACLSTLLFDSHNDSGGTDIPSSPFSEYANRHWTSHARFDGVLPRIMTALEHLLDPERPNFTDWVKRSHLDDCPDSKDMEVRLVCDDNEGHDSSPGSSLYYSALLGLHQLVDRLATSNPRLVNTFGGRSGTPLQAASANGHLETVRVLLEHGARPNARGGHCGTALCAASLHGHVDAARLLLSNGASVNSSDRSRTALTMALQARRHEVVGLLLQRGAKTNLASSVTDGDFDAVELLLRCGAAADERGMWNATPLQIAASKGDLTIARFLVEQGAKVNAPPGTSGTALQCAVLQEHYDVAEFLSGKGAAIDEPVGEGGTILQVLSAKGDAEAVQWLLRHGADANARIGEQMDPLEAASSNGRPDVVRLLLAHGANVNGLGTAALRLASSNGHLKIVNLLLEKGAIANGPGGRSESPLRVASANGHLDIVRLLRKHHADIDATSGEDNETALQAAARRGDLPTIQFLLGEGADVNWSTGKSGSALRLAVLRGHDDVARALVVDFHADANARGGPESETPLYTAAVNGRLEVVRLLLEHHADVSIRGPGPDNRTPLYPASEKGHVEIVKCLLNHGADANAVTSDSKWAPIHVAAEHKHLEVVQLLLDHRADVNIRAPQHQTPLFLVSMKGHVRIAQCLLDNGADINATTTSGRTGLYSASENGQLEVVKLLLARHADVSIRGPQDSTVLCIASEKGHPDVVRYLLDGHGVDTAAAENGGWTALHNASLYGHLEVAQHLVDHGVNINARASKGQTPLYAACLKGHVKVAQYLLDKGAEIDAVSESSRTGLYTASENGHLEVVRLLLEHRADVNIAGPQQRTPLSIASEKGHTVIVRCLLDDHRADINAVEDDGWVALQNASLNGHAEVAQLLLQHHPDVNVRNAKGQTALYVASMKGHAKVAQHLVDNGADVSVAKADGWTPLHTVAENDHLEVIQILAADRTVDVNIQGPKGQTPLYLAAYYGRSRIAQYLLDRGADANKATHDSWSPLHVAAEKDHLEVAQLLLNHQADVDSRGPDGQTPLHLAARESRTKVAQYLLDHGAQVNAANKIGRTPLHSAAEKGHLEVVELLLDHRADIGARTTESETPLYLASAGGHAKVARCLLNHGADIDAATEPGRTGLYGASRNGHSEVARLLLEFHADVNIRGPQRRTPLSIASENGHAEVVQCLLDDGRSDINAAEDDGWVALLNASLKGHTEIAQLLLQHEPDINIRNSKGQSSLYLASMKGHAKIAQCLVEHGADVNLAKEGGWTPLLTAVENNFLEVVEALAGHPAVNINIRGSQGQTPLYTASLKGHAKIVQYLLDHGADIEGATDTGWTALHTAADDGFVEVIQILLKYGAAIDRKGAQDRTALHMASVKGRHEAVQVLLEHGADINRRDAFGTALHLAASNGHVDVVRRLLEKGADAALQDVNGKTAIKLASEKQSAEIVQLLSPLAPYDV